MNPQHSDVRVLHIVDHVDMLGNGISHMAVDLACGQAKAGHHVTVYSRGGAFEALLASHGAQHVPAKWGGGVRGRAESLLDLARVLRKVRPQVVHSHFAAATLFAWMLRPVTRHRVVATAHNVFERKTSLMRVADRTIALSAAVAETLVALGVQRNRIRIILNGPLGSPRVTSTVIRGQGAPVVLDRPAVVTVAGVERRKGIDVLIEAFAGIADDGVGAPHLYIVGDGVDRAEFEALAARTPVAERIHFVGFVSDPSAYLSQSDVFVLASRREAFPLVILEARGAGCAIVAADVDGVAEALAGGEAGLLVPSEDAAALRDAIVLMLTQPDVAEGFRQAAVIGLDYFHVDRMLNETEQVYREIVRPGSLQ